MESSPSTRPSSRLLAVRVLAIVLAVAAGAFLILREQRRARPVAVRAETAAPIVDAADVTGPPIVETAEVAAGETPPAYLFSSKSVSLAPAEPAAEEGASVFLSTSKSLAPVELVPLPNDEKKGAEAERNDP